MTQRKTIMLRVKLDDLIIENTSGNILDIIQWVHKNNPFQKSWGISFRPNEIGTIKQYLETNCPQIMNAVQKEWPTAQIENIYNNNMTAAS